MSSATNEKLKQCNMCHTVCGKGKVPEEVVQELDDAFECLESSPIMSLLKKHLNKNVFDELKDLITPYGSTLWDCIKSGVVNLDSGVGIYAPDAQAYHVFDILFDNIIEDYHNGFKYTDKQPLPDWGKVSTLQNLDPLGRYVVSTRVRCGRSLEGYPFNPKMKEDDYVAVEKKVTNALRELKGDLKGVYYPLADMSPEVQKKLTTDHLLFKEGDKYLEAADANHYWPVGRGIFLNNENTFMVWVNEEDHVRIISMNEGGNLPKVYSRLVEAVRQIEKRLAFARSVRLGYLTFCPTNLGTTIRASVHIKLPNLGKDTEELELVADEFHLQVRGTGGEHTEVKDGIYDVSNKRRIGLTEYEAVKEMHDGVLELIKREQEFGVVKK
ncbi:arginine kinase-like [Onthophagus taurus]|uniref:arginine kinase-like n=1 Tax=Onthophagus taurus TaxID=166361 RepID=UPI0039BDF5D0